MTDFRERYKRVGYGREDVELNRALRSQRREEARRELRSEHYSLLRDVKSSSQNDDPSPDDSLFAEEEKKRAQDVEEQDNKKNPAQQPDDTVELRWKRLEKWREEQKRKKLQEKKKAKPVFKVGVVHHKVYSPPMNKEPAPIPPVRPCRIKCNQSEQEQPQKRVTRATEKRLAMKAVTNQQKRDNLRTKKKEENNDNNQHNIKGKEKIIELAPKDHQFKAPFGITPIPIFGRQALEATKENFNFDMSSSIHSSTANFPDSIPSSMTESIFPNSDQSLFKSKSKRRSSLNKSNAQLGDSTFNKSMDESGDAFVLKISSDDQEMLDDQESPAKRRSSKVFAPPQVEKMDVEEVKKQETSSRCLRSNKTLSQSSSDDPDMGVNESKSTNRSRIRHDTKSTNRSRITHDTISTNRSRITHETKSTIDLSYQSVESGLNPSVSNKSSISRSLTEKIDSSQKSFYNQTADSSVLNKTESPANKRKSIGKVTESPKDTSCTIENQTTDLNSSLMNSSISKQKKTESPANRRKSITKSTESPKETTVKNQAIDSNDSLMSSSISKQNKTESPEMKRKSFGNATESRRETSVKNQTIDSNKSLINSSISKQKKMESPVIRRKSIVKSTKSSKDISLKNQTIDSNDDSLMNSSSSKQNKIDSPANRRKSMFSSKNKTQSPVTRINSTESPGASNSPATKRRFSIASASKTESPKKATNKTESPASRKTFVFTPSESPKIDDPSPAKKQKFTFRETESSRRKSTISSYESAESDFLSNENEASFVTNMRRVSLEDQTQSSEKPTVDDDVFTLPKQVDSPIRKKSTRFTRSEINDLEEINLMDSTFSALPKSMKLTDNAPKSLLDDSLANFSPRRSIKPKEAKQPIKVSQSLVKLSPLKSSERPMELHKVIEDDPNSSLNMSLSSAESRPPALYSPFIVTSRGKDKSRKEVKSRRFSQPSLDDVPTKDTIMQSLNISVEEEERTAQYYKYILDKEIERLDEICDKWNAIKEDSSTPEETRYIILAAVGQTRLLLNKKFVRFRSLVTDCENGKGEMLVTCKDLQGFWEMMYMEIKDCDNRFNKLEDMKANNWIDREAVENAEAFRLQQEQQAKKKKTIKRAPVKKSAAAAKSSSLRALIMAARKKKMESGDAENDVEIKEPVVVPEPQDAVKEDNTSTPVKNTRRSSMSTPKSASKWESLLKKVQLSQTKKSTTSPLICMKLSQMCKTPEVQLDDSIIYINSDRTPAKSILKSTKDESIAKAVAKANKVFFSEQHMEVKEFERQSEGNVDDNIEMKLDDIDESKEPIERRLNFEDDSFNGSQLENLEENLEETEAPPSQENKQVPVALMKVPNIEFSPVESPTISMSPLSLEEKSAESSFVKKKSRKLKFKFNSDDDTPESPSRSLRTKKFSAPSTPIPKKLMSKMVEDEDMDVDVEDDNDNLSKSAAPEDEQVEEIYLNSKGVICKRFIYKKKDTPRVMRLKRSNSDALDRSKRTVEVTKTPSTPQARRKFGNFQIPIIEISSPGIPTPESTNKSRKPGTPHVRKHSLKRSFVMKSTTTDDTSILDVDEVSTPKLRRKTKNETELTESVKESNTPKLKRTNSKSGKIDESATPKVRRTISKLTNTTRTNSEDEPNEVSTPSMRRKSAKKSLSLDITLTDESEGVSVKESNTPKLKRKNSKSLKDDETPTPKVMRTISKLSTATRTNSEDEPKETPTTSSSLRRKSSKRLQENVEPNEQEARNKVSRTPSLKRSNSKKSTVHELSVNPNVSEEMTPNTRRKSLRLTRASAKIAD